MISAGYFFICGVTTTGAAYCWGNNEFGQLGNGSDKDSDTPVPVSGRLNFKSVSAAVGGHACGITMTGAAYCWGLNGSGQLGNGTKKNSNVPVAVSGGLTFVSISAGHFHTCGVTTDGELYCWGADGTGLGVGNKAGSAVPIRVSGLP
jgi:alpha-tubulin suppressor-like RCC1 family protein